jgi:hypothetical protein
LRISSENFAKQKKVSQFDERFFPPRCKKNLADSARKTGKPKKSGEPLPEKNFLSAKNFELLIKRENGLPFSFFIKPIFFCFLESGSGRHATFQFQCQQLNLTFLSAASRQGCQMPYFQNQKSQFG